MNLNSANWFAFFFSEAADFYDVPLLQTMSHSWLFWYFRKLALSNYPDVFSWSWTPSHNHGIQITVTLLKQLLFCVVLAGDFITAINAFDKKSFVIIFHLSLTVSNLFLQFCYVLLCNTKISSKESRRSFWENLKGYYYTIRENIMWKLPLVTYRV